jgi:hypothetical protein
MTVMQRVQTTRSSTKYTNRTWQKAYFTAAKTMSHKAAMKVADDAIDDHCSSESRPRHSGRG